MGVLELLRRVYDLDTLDTRFTSSSSVPYKAVIEARNDPAQSKEPPRKAQGRAQPSKWNTPEFYLYYLVILVALPYMFWIAYDVSRRAWPSLSLSLSLPIYSPLLYCARIHLLLTFNLVALYSIRPSLSQV